MAEDLFPPDITPLSWSAGSDAARLRSALASAREAIEAALIESSAVGARTRDPQFNTAAAAMNVAAISLAGAVEHAAELSFLLGGEATRSGVQVSDRALFDGAPDALMIIDAAWKIRSINPEFERMFGYGQEELLGHHYEDLLPVRFKSRDEGRSSILGLGLGLGRAAVGANNEFCVLRKDGTEVPVEIKAARLDEGRIVASVRDASERQRSDAGLRDALSLLGATLESTTDGILVVTLDGQVAGTSTRFLTMWGIPDGLAEAHDDEFLMSFVLEQLVDPEGFVARVRDLYSDPEAESNDVLELHDGRIFERSSRPQRVADVIVGRVWSFRDATARRRAESQAAEASAELAVQAEQLRLLAFRDPLTGLANRILFTERLEHALAGSEPSAVSVVLLNLDNFTGVNDVLGRQAGDEMLIEVSRRLKASVCAADTVARLGGDEFIVLHKHDIDPEDVARTIMSALGVPMRIAGKELRPSVSMGISSGDDTTLLGAEVIRRADIAMHAAKAAGKNCFLRFRPDMMSRLIVRADMEAGLRDAVKSNEIVVYFQPILSADGHMSQVEALARWQRPSGLVPPLKFIPLAESSGLIKEIGQEVLAQACRNLRSWLDESDRNSVAVNVSVVQLLEEDFAQRVLEVLAVTGVRPAQVVLEVTESVFLHPGTSVTDQLTLLQGRGVKVAIDDFGTGYSSLGRLHDLPLDALKIDKTFVDRIQTGAESLPIVRSMIELAHNLGLHVTAEGVETDVQARVLVNLGCDALQGYLFSRPQTLQDLPAATERSRQTMQELVLKGQAPRFGRSQAASDS